MDFQNLNSVTKEKREADIRQALDKQHDKFMTTPWADLVKDGKASSLPEWFLSDFVHVLQFIPAKTHQVFAVQLEVVLKAKIEDVKFGQVSLICNMFIDVVPCNWEANIHEYLKKLRVINLISQTWNDLFAKLERDMINTKLNMNRLYDGKQSPIISIN